MRLVTAHSQKSLNSKYCKLKLKNAMLSKTQILIAGTLLSATLTVNGQTNNTDSGDANYQLLAQSDLFVFRIVSQETEALGSTYLDESFSPGVIVIKNTGQKISFPMRYNALSNEIEIDRENRVEAIKPLGGSEVLLNNKTFVAVKHPITNKFIYVEKLVGVKAKLYDFFEVKLNKAVADATLLGIEDKDEYVIKEQLFYQLPDDTIKELPNKKKDLLNIFKKEQEFISNKKLNLKKKEDLIVLFQYLNTI